MNEQSREMREAARLGLLKLRERVDVGDVRDLMGSRLELGLTGMEWNDGGFIEAREVRVTEPWRPSLVRLGERPRVELSVLTRRCMKCGDTYKARRQSSQYCGATCRQAAKRSRIDA